MPATWSDVSRRTGLTEFSPANQDRNAWALAEQQYARYTFGRRSLEADIASGGHEADIANALRGTWPSLPGGTQQNTTAAQFRQRLDSSLNKYNRAPSPELRPDPSLAPNRLAGPRVSSSSTSNATSLDVGTINIHTQATDGRGIGADIERALSESIANQANRGLQ
jgi:hypothetical protein